MVRNLYRFYLYIVYIVLLLFIVVALRGLLSVVLAFTPLHGSMGAPPDHTLVVQSISFAAITLVIAGALASLHYWLIRRDMNSDVMAGASAIRSFFLNLTEALGVAAVVPLIGFAVIGGLARNPESSVVEYAAYAFPTFVLVIWLEVERRKAQVTAGAALTFQRLHLYGIQILLLIFLAVAWWYEIRSIVDGMFLGGQALRESCTDGSYCPHDNLFGLAMSLVWFVAAWLVYGWMLKNDNSSFLRLILHYLQFAVGVNFLLFGCYLSVQVILWAFIHPAVALRDIFGPPAFYDFVSPITLGVVVMLVYHGWLRAAVRQGIITRGVLFLTECAVIAFLAAGAFWWGCRDLLYGALQVWTHTVQRPEMPLLISAIASGVVGVGYIGLDVYLWRRDVAESTLAAGPRRGLVFALLGGGILVSAISGAIALYAWATALFGSPLDNGQVIINESLSTFIVGVLLVGIYLWVALRGHLFSTLSKKLEPVSSTITPNIPVASEDSTTVITSVSPEQPATLEVLLDDLLAGKITRDEAAMYIRSLTQASVNESSQPMQ